MGKTAKWQDQCKVEFLFAADHLIHKNGGKGIKTILQNLSNESNIPFKTLHRWFYQRDKNSLKNETTEPGTSSITLCRICGVRPVRQQSSADGKPRPHTRCWQCEQLASTHRKNFFIACPHCAKDIFLNKADLKRRIINESSSEA